MNDSMIVSRMIFGAECDPALLDAIRPADVDKDVQITLSVFQTTASRGNATGRVLCCWAGGHLEPSGEILMTPVGQAAVDALMRLPACMDDQLADKGRLVVRELKVGKTPLREKVIDAVLEAEPGDRLCFLGDLAGELDGQMFLTFNAAEGEPIILGEDE
jgi:hypothetical protein